MKLLCKKVLFPLNSKFVSFLHIFAKDVFRAYGDFAVYLVDKSYSLPLQKKKKKERKKEGVFSDKLDMMKKSVERYSFVEMCMTLRYRKVKL